MVKARGRPTFWKTSPFTDNRLKCRAALATNSLQAQREMRRESGHPDGPDRSDRHQRRFNLSACRGSAGARGRVVLLHARPAGLARRPRHGSRLAADAFAAKRATISRLATKPRSICRSSTWSGCARIRPSTWGTSPPPICWSDIGPGTLVVNDPFWVRNFPEKLLVLRVSRPDAADDHRARSGHDSAPFAPRMATSS